MVPPSLHFWAPWIGRNTRLSDTVLNTEFQKVHPSHSVSDNLISEDRLTEELFKQKVCFLFSEYRLKTKVKNCVICTYEMVFLIG